MGLFFEKSKSTKPFNILKKCDWGNNASHYLDGINFQLNDQF